MPIVTAALAGAFFIVKQRGHDIHLTVDVVTATLVYNMLYGSEILVTSRSGLRGSVNRTEAGTVHSEDIVAHACQGRNGKEVRDTYQRTP